MKKILTIVFFILLASNQVYSSEVFESEMDKIYETIVSTYSHDYNKNRKNILGYERPIFDSIKPFKLKYCKDKKTNKTFTVISKFGCYLPEREGWARIKVRKGKKISKNEFLRDNPNFSEKNNLICIKGSYWNDPFKYYVLFLTHTLDNKIYLNSVIPAGIRNGRVFVHDTKQKGFWHHQGVIERSGKNFRAVFYRYSDKETPSEWNIDITKSSGISTQITPFLYNSGYEDLLHHNNKCYSDNAYWAATYPNRSLERIDSKSKEKQIAETKKKEEEKRIAEEKRKAEEEEKRIAETKKKEEESKIAEEEELYVIGSGTGFFVNDEGYIATNEHVAGICQSLASYINGETHIFKIIALDKRNDLAVLRGDYRNKTYLNINVMGPDFGEDIMAFGFPLAENLSSSVKLTRGIVSSLSGPNNDITLIQIDAAIQPGNSGGPVLNYNGQVVGVASSGLNKIEMLLDEESPYIPENVNFAVSANTLTSFLRSNRVNIFNKSYEKKSSQELAKIGMPPTIQLHCLNTKTAFNNLKKNEKYNDVLLKKVVDLK